MTKGMAPARRGTGMAACLAGVAAVVYVPCKRFGGGGLLGCNFYSKKASKNIGMTASSPSGGIGGRAGEVWHV